MINICDIYSNSQVRADSIFHMLDNISFLWFYKLKSKFSRCYSHSLDLRKFMALTFIVILLSLGAAQSVKATSLAGQTYFSLEDLANLLNHNSSTTENSFTLRRGDGVLVAFTNDPDLMWTPENSTTEIISLASPILKRNNTWFASTELLSFFKVSLSGNTLTLPDGIQTKLSFPTVVSPSSVSQNTSRVALDNGGTALVFYASNSAGTDALSLMIMDLGAVSITSRYSANLKKGKPLYFILTAIAESTWQSEIIFRQGDKAFAARYPLNITVLEGEKDTVGPEKPVSGVVNLPDHFDLRSNINVQWAGINADFRFQQ